MDHPVILIELSLYCVSVPSFPQTFGIHLQSEQVVSTVAQVDVSVQMLVELSKERYSQPVVEFWQLALHSHMSSTMNTSTTVPWHWPGWEQSAQATKVWREGGVKHEVTMLSCFLSCLCLAGILSVRSSNQHNRG